MSDDLKRRVAAAAGHVAARAPGAPRVGIVLGSGLGPLADRIEDPVAIPYETIPHFAPSTVHGHAGKLILGRLAGHRVVAMQGRYHYYEGHGIDAVTFPIRVMKALGIEVLVTSNATGGLNRNYRVGDLMVVEDQLNWMGVNPLVGPNDPSLGPRFLDMSEPFSRRLIDLAQAVALELGIPVRQGVLAAVSGPNYETMAELRMLARLGADAVGMSTIPEVIVAKHAGIAEVLSISCITDMATGEAGEPISHAQVLAAAKQAEGRFQSLVLGVLKRL